jgi:acetyl-CoA C-acetyltransferase
MAGLSPEDIDIVEANESFSVSPLVVQRAFGFADDIINVDGGAVSMGHPLGGSGGMLLATALDALERTGGRYALLTIPAALGLGTAIVVERLDDAEGAPRQ